MESMSVASPQAPISAGQNAEILPGTTDSERRPHSRAHPRPDLADGLEKGCVVVGLAFRGSVLGSLPLSLLWHRDAIGSRGRAVSAI